MSDRDDKKYTLWYTSGDRQASVWGGDYDSEAEAWEARLEVEKEFRAECSDDVPYDEDATWSVEPSEENRTNKMTDSVKAPTCKTVGKLTASEILEGADIIETISGDFLLMSGDYELQLTDEYQMAVGALGDCICVMDLTGNEQDKLSRFQDEIEEWYQEKTVKWYRDPRR